MQTQTDIEVLAWNDQVGEWWRVFEPDTIRQAEQYVEECVAQSAAEGRETWFRIVRTITEVIADTHR